MEVVADATADTGYEMVGTDSGPVGIARNEPSDDNGTRVSLEPLGPPPNDVVLCTDDFVIVGCYNDGGEICLDSAIQPSEYRRE